MMRLSSLLLALALAACASAPVYQPATRGGVGYSETRVENDRYRVTYRGGRTAQEAEDFALLRAADLTLAQGYEWFLPLARTAEGGSGPGARPTGGVGVSVGSGGYSGVGVGLGIALGGGQKAQADLEVRLGRGAKPEAAYDARNVAETLRARLTAPGR